MLIMIDLQVSPVDSSFAPLLNNYRKLCQRVWIEMVQDSEEFREGRGGSSLRRLESGPGGISLGVCRRQECRQPATRTLELDQSPALWPTQTYVDPSMPTLERNCRKSYFS